MIGPTGPAEAAAGGAVAPPAELRRYAARIERALAERLAGPAGDETGAALRYAALGGGKRLRPALTLATAEALGGAPESVLDSACGIELVHVASLLFDDLPCMDDHAERRGRPTTHRTFGEASAVLAGVMALTRGFALVAADAQALGCDPAATLAAQQALHRAVLAMCVGQRLDLAFADGGASFANVQRIHRGKTAPLFAAAAEVPARLLGAPPAITAGLAAFGQALGEAFQLWDDLHAEPGEPGPNAVRSAGAARVRRLLAQRIAAAEAAVAPLGERAAALRRMAAWLTAASGG